MKNQITTLNTAETGGVFYGSARLCVDKKNHTFTVSNHLSVDKEYEFRAISKAKAGFNTIFDFKSKPSGVWYNIGKDTQCVQVKYKSKFGDQWFHVYIAKGGIWQTVDVTMLDNCTVGDVHSSAPKMADFDTWNRMNAETWADKAFCMNKPSKKKK